MLPRLDMASVMPRPVDLMVVGKVSEEMSPKRANPTVLKSLLMPRKMISVSWLSVTCTSMPNPPERSMSTTIQNFLFILWQKKLVKKQLANSKHPITSILVQNRYPQSSTEYWMVQQNPLLQACAKLRIISGIRYLVLKKVSFICQGLYYQWCFSPSYCKGALPLNRAMQLRLQRHYSQRWCAKKNQGVSTKKNDIRKSKTRGTQNIKAQMYSQSWTKVMIGQSAIQPAALRYGQSTKRRMS